MVSINQEPVKSTGAKAPPQRRDPEKELKEYMQANNCSREEAIKALEKLHGGRPKPKTGQNNDVDMKNRPPRSESGVSERNKHLVKIGIPPEVIVKGDSAIEQYAEAHNIKLPPKREK